MRRTKRLGRRRQHLDRLRAMALDAPENEKFGRLVAVLENELPPHLAARMFGHHHDVWRIARFTGKA